MAPLLPSHEINTFAYCPSLPLPPDWPWYCPWWPCVLCFLFLEICVYKCLPSWQSFPCLYVLTYLIKTNPRNIFKTGAQTKPFGMKGPLDRKGNGCQFGGATSSLGQQGWCRIRSVPAPCCPLESPGSFEKLQVLGPLSGQAHQHLSVVFFSLQPLSWVWCSALTENSWCGPPVNFSHTLKYYTK